MTNHAANLRAIARNNELGATYIGGTLVEDLRAAADALEMKPGVEGVRPYVPFPDRERLPTPVPFIERWRRPILIGVVTAMILLTAVAWLDGQGW